jgi:hypothetical protein
MLEQQNALYPKTKKLFSVLIFESHVSFHSLQSGPIIAFVKFAGSVKIAIDHATGRHTTGCMQGFQICTADSIDVSNVLFSKPAL